MLIRYGYEMTFGCAAPTPMVCQLDVHPSCSPAIRAETPFASNPRVESGSIPTCSATAAAGSLRPPAI